MSSDGVVLVTGGAGYVGSHAVVELINAGYKVVVLDNLVNASMESLKRVNEITGTQVPTHSVDLLDRQALTDLFKQVTFEVSMLALQNTPMGAGASCNAIMLYLVAIGQYKVSCVMHFAGLKAVGESCDKPLLYYKNNIGGTTNLLEVMKEFGVYNIIFSSSATVYGPPSYLPIDEKHPAGGCTNPYGKTKYFIEEIMKDMCVAEKQWNVVLLRYFNPVGAHASGKIGEDPQGIPNNLMPFIAQVAVGRRSELQVFGDDYETPDGTGVRDYIHVVDLVQGHVAALKKIEEGCGCKVYNLGTGQGYSVLEMAKAFEKASGKPIPYKIAPRRAGDIASCYADASLAEKELGWTAKLDLSKMCEDIWRWQSMNPKGFNKDS